MNEEKALRQIKEIAEKLCRDNQTFSRADVAYELKGCGVTSDSDEVSRLIYAAYSQNNNSQKIANALISNDNRTTVVEEYELNHLLINGKNDRAIAIAKDSLDDSSRAIAEVSKLTSTLGSPQFANQVSSIMNVVSGTSGIQKVQQQAAGVFNDYTKLVTAYHFAQDSVRDNIEDFTSLRSSILDSYRKYSTLLVEVYGDSIKAISPALFDFNKVEWLDVDNMLKEVQLDYDRLSDNCSALISEISQDFSNTVRASLQTYKSAAQGSKALGLALAGLAMFSHYCQASERANRMKSDLLRFKTSVKKDSTTIAADMGRLKVIYDSFNNVIIPRASIYLRHAADLMDSDIEEIKRALYLSPKAKQLDAERKELLESLMVLDMEINDHLQNIDIYNSLVKDAEAYLQSKQSSYEQAKSSKPSKPFFLFNWLSFGALKKNYNRNIYEWDASCRPLIAEYENLQVDHKLNNDELAAHRKGLAETKQRYTQLNQKLKSINDKIKKELAASPEVKTKMLKHLRPLVGLMRLGREIAESKLDSRLVSAVSVKLNGDVPQLSSELEQHIDNFGKTLSENLNISHRSVAQMIDGADPLMLPKDNEQAEMIIREREADVAKLTETANNSIQQGISLLQNVAKLKIEQENNRLTRAAYDREYDRLMSQFKWMLSSVNDKANVVREISRKVNLATSAEERKRNLLLLSELSGSSLSEADFEEFINGDKTITL